MREQAYKRAAVLFQRLNDFLTRTDPECTEILVNFSQGEAAGASRLTERERMFCILTALLGYQGFSAFRTMVHGALQLGLDPVAIKEIIYQYGGQASNVDGKIVVPAQSVTFAYI